MYVATKDFHSPFTGLIVYTGQAVLVPAAEQDGETLKKLISEGLVAESDTAIGAYGSAPTEGVHDRSQITERDQPGQERHRVHDGTMKGVIEARARFGSPPPRAEEPTPDSTEEPPPELSKMTKAELEAHAAEKGVDITSTKTKADIIAAIEANAAPEAPAS